MQAFYIGVDGGATKCIVRVEDETGQLIGRETTGPANIRISVPQAWESINAALEAIFKPLGLTFGDPAHHWHAGMGLAGCEVEEAYEAFLDQAPEMTTLVISSDAHTACLGAHSGHNGAIIVIGTGVVGFEVETGETTKVAGWGFPHDDEGGGAWLGLEAVKHTLKALDGRDPVSGLAEAIFNHFGDDLNRFVTWANQANSTAFAELAPLVVTQSQAGDERAYTLLQQAARAVDAVATALHSAQTDQTTALPCALIGGIAPFVQPYLSAELRARLQQSAATPDAGAILLVRSYLAATQFNDDIEAAHG